jgi:hypothetical protein
MKLFELKRVSMKSGSGVGLSISGNSGNIDSCDDEI